MSATTEGRTAFVIGTSEGKPLHILGHSVTIKVSSQDAEGNYYTYEVLTPPSLGIPPHVHEREDEVIAVLEGEYEVWLDGKTYKATSGSVLHFPRAIPHGFQNVGSTPGRTLWTVVPGSNFELFFEKLGKLPPGPPEMDRVAAIFSEHNIRILSASEV